MLTDAQLNLLSNMEHVPGPSSSSILPRGGQGREVSRYMFLKMGESLGGCAQGWVSLSIGLSPHRLTCSLEHTPWEKCIHWCLRCQRGKERYAQGEREGVLKFDQLNVTYFRIRCFICTRFFTQSDNVECVHCSVCVYAWLA